MKEWYLMQSPTLTSGDESELLNEYGDDAVNELLESGVAYDVELYNYDLTEMKQVKAIVEGNVQDTKLKALVRRLIVPIGTCKAGMYVKYKNRYWLIVGLVDDNIIYEKAVMTLCNYYLTWVNQNGEIIQRWAAIQSASQYNNGETGQLYYRVRSDQLLVLLPDDDESLLIDTGMRFVIDRRCEVYEKGFADDVEIDTSNRLFIYEATRADTTLYDYQDSGHTEFLASQDEQRATDGYYKIDGKGYWLATYDKYENKEETANSCVIYGVNDTVYIDVEPAVFVGKAIRGNDQNEDVVITGENWSVECDFVDRLIVEYYDNSISIGTSDESLAEKELLLTLSVDGYGECQKTVHIKPLF